MTFEISDWVQGKTVDGEFIHGYIETADAQQGIARVHVVQSDNEDTLGRTIAVRDSWLRKLPVNPLGDKKNLESLIDVALSTSDEAWFTELTDRLNNLKKAKGAGNQEIRISDSLMNRLGLFEKK